MSDGLGWADTVITVSIILGFLVWRWKPARQGAPATAAPDVPAEFGRRRSRMLRRGLLPMWAGAATALLGIWIVLASALPAAAGVALVVVAIAAFSAGFLAMEEVYRCPACEGPISDGEGILLAVRACPRCGARLR
jgi:hypothetical protein